MNLGLNDKRCLITGASRGIGAAIAERFLEEGAKVFLVSRGQAGLTRKTQELQEQFGSARVKSLISDCTKAKSLEKLEDEIRSSWSGIDIVIANVGDGRGTRVPIPSAADWKKIWSVNFESALHTARTFLPMLEESEGCLLFISSIAGREVVGAPVSYSTSKAAVQALAKNLATSLAPRVRVNVLSPGNVITPDGSWSEKWNRDPVGVSQLIESTVPMERFGKPGEIADAAVFLCSKRSSFTTGSVLVIDGGQSVGVC